MGKSTWFRQKKAGRNGDNENSKKVKLSNQSTHKQLKHPRATSEMSDNDRTPLTVLFVPRTPGGELARRVRQSETEMEKLTGYRVKIVERGGCMIKRMVVKTNPWAEGSCGRQECLICRHEKGAGECSKRSVTYRTRCEVCHERREKEKEGEAREMVYIGESARTGYERGQEHEADYSTAAADSHMYKHWQTDHQDEDRPTFSMKILKRHKSAFVRQISEAVLIEMHCEKDTILNSKSEYNRCQIPRLSVKMGEKDVNSERVTVHLTEADIEFALEDTKNRKRENDKPEAEHQPNRKRMKLRMKKPEFISARKRTRKEAQSTNRPGKRQRLEKEEEGEGECSAPNKKVHNCNEITEKVEKVFPGNVFKEGGRGGEEMQKKQISLYPIFNSVRKPRSIQAENKANPASKPSPMDQPPPKRRTQKKKN